MTDLNKLDTKTAHTKVESRTEPPIDPQQVSIKAWSQKLLVILLCVASFYGGWKSHESSMVNQCFASGGQIVEGGKTILCELS
ncbi:hypothetical protein [Psychrobacter sp. LV10R520-6]|uniref:hypothetical protein n=1 Tax=Psychrobacter sp. LV10R520-6 TaxID=1415574 RepID=UPI0024CBB170|nr:hypothetical protein [Psychrobacter sp. LV10R520-6]SNT69397.1 hypothetical protein SAMN04488491_0480 [Psychrobacter sp. LV10R520-6]